MTSPDAPARDLVDTVFDHHRRKDGAHACYIEMSADRLSIPYDLLWTRHGEPTELDAAKDAPDAAGLRLLAEDWLLREEASDGGAGVGPAPEGAAETGNAAGTYDNAEAGPPSLTPPLGGSGRGSGTPTGTTSSSRASGDMSAHVAKAVNLGEGIRLPLPTTRLRPAGSRSALRRWRWLRPPDPMGLDATT